MSNILENIQTLIEEIIKEEYEWGPSHEFEKVVNSLLDLKNSFIESNSLKERIDIARQISDKLEDSGIMILSGEHVRKLPKGLIENLIDIVTQHGGKIAGAAALAGSGYGLYRHLKNRKKK